MEYTEEPTLKQRFADKLVNCDTHFDNNQLVAILDICDELGIPDMYEALKHITEDWGDREARQEKEIFDRLEENLFYENEGKDIVISFTLVGWQELKNNYERH